MPGIVGTVHAIEQLQGIMKEKQHVRYGHIGYDAPHRQHLHHHREAPHVVLCVGQV
jgi:hypothetical protein